MKLLFLLFLVFNFSVFGQDRYSTYTNLLSDHVENGFVNYKALKTDLRLDSVLKNLSNTDPDTIKSTAEQIAFWINVYNAYTLKVIVDNYPLESINDLHGGGLVIGLIFGTTIWDEELVFVKNKVLTLNDVEHEILRKKYSDPRIHFALVCASLSCPPLRNEAYEASKLDLQLTDQGKIFLANTFKNYFDLEKKTAFISKIFDWFDEDFGDNDEEILLFISGFVNNDIAKNIKSNLSDWEIDYLDYDWGLNENKRK